MAHVGSGCDPPRVSGMHRFRNGWFAVRRRLWGIHGLRVPGEAPVSRLLLIGLIPAYGFAVRGYLAVALWAVMLWVAAAFVLFIYLGQTAATYATAAMVAIHATGMIAALHRDVFFSTRPERLGARFLAVFLLVVVVYFPAFQLLRQFAFPMVIAREVVVINGMSFTRSLERGDVVGYHIRERGGYNVRLRGGYALDRVLALPGDRVVFAETFFEVNGEAFPRLERMERSGEIIVPERHWFIWPSSVRGGGDTSLAVDLMMKAAIVPRRRIIGKPYEHWFGRKQTYSFHQ